MRRFVISISFLLFLRLAGGVYSQSRTEPLIVPREIMRFSDITLDNVLVLYDYHIQSKSPFWEGDLGFVVAMNNGTVRRYGYDLKTPSIIPVIVEGYSINCSAHVANNQITLLPSDGFFLTRIGNTQVYKVWSKPNNSFVALIDNWAIVIGRNYIYTSCIISAEGTFTTLDHSQTLSYAINKGGNFSVDGEIISFDGIPLRVTVDQFDDDNNQYNGVTATCPGRVYYTLKIKDYQNLYTSFCFDNEGNVYCTNYSNDEKRNLVLYYAGRDWGYREAPKKAITTDSGLRIRLRSRTDAFILGTLENNQRITILKTGETATIGGVTAPWYRIKTEDGLIGWAFGGYIRIIE
jgi:hypothetical protein